MKCMLKIILLSIAVTLCAGCGSKNTQQQAQTITVALKSNSTILYFNSTVKPLKSYPVNSKIDGIIKKMYFDYGSAVAVDQLLFVLRSPQLEDEYEAALTDYLKAKRDSSNDQLQMQGTEELNKLGMISAQEYRSSKATSYNIKLTLAQAKRKLQAVLVKFNAPPNAMQLLDSSDDLDKVNKLLAKQIGTIKIFAPATGVALTGGSGTGGGTAGGGGGSGELAVNSEVKAAQTLVIIGNKNGLLFDVKASEIAVNTISVGQAAIITGDGFPGITLHGKVFFVERQPSSSNDGGGMPSFLVHIVVPTITDEQREKIRIGMSTRIKLPLAKKPVIKIPLTAVFTKQGQSMVQMVNPKTGAITNVPVMTGPTTLDSVEIQQGLKPGDKVLINANTGN